MAGFTGNVTVSAGRLNVPASLNTPVIVEPRARSRGEISLPSLTLNGGTVLFDPNTAGALAVTNLVINSNSLLDVSPPLQASAPSPPSPTPASLAREPWRWQRCELPDPSGRH